MKITSAAVRRVVATAAVLVGTVLVAPQPASAIPPTQCQLHQQVGIGGSAWAYCFIGHGLFWVQASCGTSALNRVYVAIGPRITPGTNVRSSVSCGNFGARYLIGAALKTQDD